MDASDAVALGAVLLAIGSIWMNMRISNKRLRIEGEESTKRLAHEKVESEKRLAHEERMLKMRLIHERAEVTRRTAADAYTKANAVLGLFNTTTSHMLVAEIEKGRPFRPFPTMQEATKELRYVTAVGGDEKIRTTAGAAIAALGELESAAWRAAGATHRTGQEDTEALHHLQKRWKEADAAVKEYRAAVAGEDGQ